MLEVETQIFKPSPAAPSVCMSRKLEKGAKPELEPKQLNVECRHPKQQFNQCTTCLPGNVFCTIQVLTQWLRIWLHAVHFCTGGCGRLLTEKENRNLFCFSQAY